MKVMLLSPLPLLMLCLLLSACGFSPVYGTKNGTQQNSGQDSVRAAFDQIYINNVKDREGQYLRNALIDRFYSHGRPVRPRYELTVTGMTERLTNLDITKSSDATRGQLRLDIKMALKDRASDEQLLERDLTAITSYNILESQFTTRVTEENARQNALDDLARQIERQLALYFNRAPRK